MQMSDAGRSWLLDRVVGVVLAWDESPARAARRLDALLRGATPHEVMRLESDYRGRRHSLGVLCPDVLDDDGITDDDGVTDAPGKADAPAEAADGEEAGGGTVPGRYGPAVAALMSFDRSGHIRETGVARLAGTGDPFALPFLLLRLNDPVEQVRDLARDAVTTRLDPGHVDLLVQLLPLLDGLRGRRRAGRLLTSVEDLLHRHGTVALWRGARSDDPPVRASCLRRLARTEPVAAVGTAFSSREPSLWQWGARVATSARLAPAEQDALLPHLEASSNPRIRLRALRARARQPHGEVHLRRAMLDPDARVRYHARATLYARGHTDLAPRVYRDALAPAHVPDAIAVGALGGLSDLGGACDVPRILDFTAHPGARVRAEAWRALNILAPSEVAARIDRLAADPSGKVRRHLPRRPPE
ncbi:MULTISPECIES: hypothetical protein [unclassified Streptomyces]|uniref:hypothetical protein n=1 Tax=unclassified Streptomyces TaxID=2593676 RepID=UPI0011E7D514|nr:hypothetical protein [Streptomyces sp. sk2.1]TXS78111.1 hypothetical protein EAO76_06675 [Streptomyces sp. sk2.1]